jgi:uncharacterized integral membrane protein
LAFGESEKNADSSPLSNYLPAQGEKVLSKIRTLVADAQLILFIIVLILFTIFLLQNTSTIQVNFLVFETQIPTVILILVATLVGFFGGYLFAIRLRRTQKKDSLVRE